VPPSPYPTQGKGNSVHARWDASFYRSLDVLPSFLELVALIVVVTYGPFCLYIWNPKIYLLESGNMTMSLSSH
jgi:hypothetical protein